jgi:UDP-glucose 4-epimerase
MRSIVTGGCGFIGSHLAEALLGKGHEVIVIDNLEGGHLANLTSFADHPQFKFIHADIRDVEAIAAHFKGVDWVFHLAGVADIVPSIEQPDRYFRTNVHGTLNVLQAAKAAGVARLVYAASSSSYGIPDTYPTTELASIQPQYPYALTKYMGEELVLHWTKVYQLPAVSLRLFNVFGPRARTTGAYGAVFGVFLAQKLKGCPFTVVGDGTQTRDFTFVADVVAAFIAAAQSGVSGEAMNVGSGGHYSVNRLVELLGGDVTNIPKRPGEPDCTFADTSKINRLLNWYPRVSFEQGVAIMLEELDRWRDAPVWNADSIREATSSWFRHLGEPNAERSAGPIT